MSEKNGVVGAVKHMKKSGALRVVIICVIAGALLLTVGSLGIFENKNDTPEQSQSEKSSYGSFLEYKDAMEAEIKGLCLSVSGISEVNVVVFFDSVGGSMYAQNSQSSNSTEKSEYVIIGSGSNSHALYLGESLPQLSGVGVVCRTGNSMSLRNELTALIAATYGLSMTRVYVAEAD